MKDVLIVGSGAGGGPLALALSEAGYEVLVLEKGPRYERQDYVADEVAVTRRDFFLPPLAEDPHILVEDGNGFPQPTYLGWIGHCVGGGTVRMGGYLYRFHPDDFRLRSRCGDYEELADWPYSYADLEPYYTRAEWALGIAGAADSNPFEGPRSRPYPLPPLAAHPLATSFDRSCEGLGLNPFPTPRSLNSRPFEGRPACAYCRLCAGYGCRIGAKSSSQEALLSRAFRTGRCEVRALAMVHRITVGRDGRVTGCLYFDAAGRVQRVEAKVVCVCCSAVESARLLLLSRSSRFPDGLANGSGLVGRHLQFHGFSNGRGHFRFDDHRDLPLRDEHPFFGRSVMDHYWLPSGVSDLPKGGLLRFGFPGAGPIETALRTAENGNGALLWGDELKHRLRQRFHDYRVVDFEVFHDFIPNAGTYVELDPQVRDKWGLPAARIHLAAHEHQRRAGRWLVDRGLEILDAMGADELVSEEIGNTAGVLVHGTCRAGTDPATSVLNEVCQAHEVPNLFVVDGSFMPTSGGGPPTLTIVANSFRTADHIISRARAGDFE